MEALFGLVILIIICAFIAGGMAGLIARSKRSRPNIGQNSRPIIAPDWQPPKADSLPYLKKQYFFSAAERSFYEILKRLAPAEHTVFAKVRLADLVYVSKGTASWQSHFNRINRKHLDFVLCNRDLAPLVAIELDDSSHDEEDRQSRDEFVDEVLAAAALPILHVRAKRAYNLDEVRRLLSPYVRVQSPAAVANRDAPYTRPAGWHPAV
ncbi:MAG TPA: DUF2726 domain-containing protein [Chthoniobacterales bacterium]